MVSAIVLSAGESKRMGRPKALLRLGGRTFLETICARLREAGMGEVVVVLGADADAVRRGSLLSRERFVVNREYREGQLSSLQRGLSELSPRADAALVTLVDHPLVLASTYSLLTEEWERDRGKIIVAEYRGRGGHPVVFPRAVFGELMAAPLAEGARHVVRKDSTRVVRVKCDDPGIIDDIDYPEDYEKAVNSV